MMTEEKITKREKIKSAAIKILKSNPEGVRYADLVREVHSHHPAIPVNTIHGTVWNLDQQIPNEIYKPARGLFRHTYFREKEIREEQKINKKTGKIVEEEFYQPFAVWLKENEDCDKAIPLGGNKFRDKWGTPDVIGKRESLRSDMISFPTEITSAEIKTDSRDLITAFGQACAYRLFSHRCYIVVPKQSSVDDISRLDTLCIIFGIGLILFDNTDVYNPKFEIRVRPTKYDPDMFYVNKYMKLIEKELFR